MKDKGQTKTKTKTGKENTSVLFRDLCRFNECKNNPQTQLQVTQHKFSV